MYQEVIDLLSAIHDPQQVMDLVVLRLPSLLDVDAATIRLLDHGSGDFVLGAASGVSEEYLSRTTIDSEEVMAMLLEGKPTAIKDISSTCDHDGCDLINREGINSIMSLPIIFKEQIIGLLRLLSRESRNFSQSEINFAMSLAKQVGAAICNGRIFQEMESQVRFFSAQREISSLVNSTLDLETILETIVNRLPELFGVDGCTIRLLHPATNRLDLVASFGLSQEYLKRGSISREDSIFSVLQGDPICISDAAADERVKDHAAITLEGIKSILAIPITNHGEIIGVLRLLSKKSRLFSASEINFATSVAEEGGNAIEKARTYRKITLLFNQIEEHERLLQTILDSLWLELVVLDQNSNIIMTNRLFRQQREIVEEQLIGRSISTIFPVLTDRDDAQPIDHVLTRKEGITLLFTEKNGRDGEQFYEHHFAPILDSDGSVEFIILAVRDITDQLTLEREKMERMKLEGVVQMAGTAAHELNTPLFAAMGTAQLLHEDLKSEEMIEDMNLILRNMQTMKKLIQDMTSLTGFESAEYVGSTKIIALPKGESDEH